MNDNIKKELEEAKAKIAALGRYGKDANDN